MGGFEADDLIATYARQAAAQGATVRIVSSDKDLMQLIVDGVIQLYDPMKNRTLGPEAVMEKFGVTPDKVIDGTVRVGGESIDPADVSAEEGLTVYGDNVACKQGDTIDYYINIKNNNGLAAALVWFYFDSNAMEFESAEEAGEFADMITDGTVKVGARSGKSQK
ncbi:MAG: DNA polymerase I [Firmicutes bacterium ADurb.BinA205]|nr:MAG: DNA polymerase I [Firmicutes bacterium ADurb.BinA205]